MSDDTSILLVGLDGSNPLAFLAALGTFRTLTLALPEEAVRMRWEQHDGAWRPRVWCSVACDPDAFIEKLSDHLATAANRASFAIGDNLNLPADMFQAHLRQAVQDVAALVNPLARTDVDFLAAFGSEVITNKDGTMQDTALRTMSGAGHQHFLKFFRELVSKTDAGHLRRALLHPWDYADEGRGMNLRWDPLDDRRYALRWEDPSGDPVKTMRGANRLAIEALPLLPTMPTASGLVTTSVQGSGRRGTFFTWPIWSPAIPLPVVSTLLGNVESLKNNVVSRTARGVSALYTSARITTGKFRNFTPSAPA